MAASGGAVYLQSVQSCSAEELQAVNLTSADKRGSLQSVRVEVSKATTGVPPDGYSAPSTHNSHPVGANLESPPNLWNIISTVVLLL
jgi:hypothetical protein